MGFGRCGRGACREFARGRPGFRRCGQELTQSSSEVDRDSDNMVGSSPKVCQRFVRKFIRCSPISYPELTGRMLGVHREFTEGDRELIGVSPEGCRKFNEGDRELIGVSRGKGYQHLENLQKFESSLHF
ncbi:hypothetical protein BHM03_00034566 [Ensete ventricosum]|nr:hypothetical protein BHM03_00034566 [Ensete ventricosum]